MSDQPLPSQPNPYGAVPVFGAQPGMPGTLPYVQAHFGRVADFGPRVVAALIDALIGLLPLLVTLVGAFMVGASFSGSGDVPALRAVGIVLAVGGYLGSLALNLWNRVFRMGRTGQSIGKSSQGLMLIDATGGRPIGAGNTFLRELVNGIANQALYLGYLWMLWDADKQTLGDKVMRSAVIHVSRT